MPSLADGVRRDPVEQQILLFCFDAFCDDIQPKLTCDAIHPWQHGPQGGSPR